MVEANKPAFFRKEFKEKPKDWREQEYEAYKKLEQNTKMNFNPDEQSYEKLREFFKVPKDKNVITDMNDQVFERLHARI